jgi:small subunit ribosomal protein S9
MCRTAMGRQNANPGTLIDKWRPLAPTSRHYGAQQSTVRRIAGSYNKGTENRIIEGTESRIRKQTSSLIICQRLCNQTTASGILRPDFFSSREDLLWFVRRTETVLGCAEKMNTLRLPFRLALQRSCTRSLATAPPPFVPPESLRHMDERPRRTNFRSQDNDSRRRDYRRKPESSAFYSGRASYYDHLKQLEDAIQTTRRALTTLQLLPLPSFARSALVALPTVWKDRDEMSPVLSTRLTNSRYRRVTLLLGQLNEYRRIAVTAGCRELSDAIAQILDMFERDSKEAVLARGKRKPVRFDEYGRSYTVGRRKTSSARVWIIRTLTPDEELQQDAAKEREDIAEGENIVDATASQGDADVNVSPSDVNTSGVPTTDAIQAESHSESANALRLSPDVLPASSPVESIYDNLRQLLSSEPPSSPRQTPAPAPPVRRSTKPVTVTPSTILVNNTPLAEYFPLMADRERVVRPLKISGGLGGFNVFALVRGGGMTGQSGAIALGIAKGLAAHEPEVENVLRKGLLHMLAFFILFDS